MINKGESSMTDADIPDYVCCVVTESVWTWFLTTVLSLLLFAIATLRYAKRYLGSERFASKNQHLLAKQLIEYGREAKSILRSDPVPESEFLTYCSLRLKHSVVIDKLEFAKTLEYDEDKETVFQLSKQTSPSLRNLQAINWIYGRTEEDRIWIVTDGPQEKTVIDFWLTIWEQRCTVIVMLSKTFEIVKMVCVQYWPNHPGNDSQQVYGDLTVTLIKEHSFAHYKIRQLRVQNGALVRVVHLFQYLDWPASAHPDTTSLLHFRRKVHEHLISLESNEPALIHCQTSKRRSGTFLAIEFALSGRERTRNIDILGSVRWLRCQNPSLVASPEQYHFIYELVEDCVLCGDTRVPCQFSCSDEVDRLIGNESLQVSASIDYDKEYQKLCSLPNRLSMGDCAAGHRGDNREKNRNVLVVPPDEWRPYLTTFQSNTNGDYINAVFVDGFKTEHEFIAAEWPFSHTAANFWSMVYDHDVAAVVVLNCPPSKLLVLKNFIDFWPQALPNAAGKLSQDDVVKHFGPVFSVEALSREVKLDGDLGIWQLKICKKEIAPHKKPASSNIDVKGMANNITSLSTLLLGKAAPSKTVKLIQIRKSWPQNQNVPDSTQSLLQVMEEVETWRAFKRANPRNKRGDTEERVAIVSCDGISRVGVYCTAVHSIEKADAMGHFDVFQSAKSVRRSRPELIQNADEYKFCYDLVWEHVRAKAASTEQIISHDATTVTTTYNDISLMH